MRHRRSHARLDNALDKIDAFIRLLSYLQDVGTPESRQANANAEGYLVEVLMREVHIARKSARKIARKVARRAFS